ncbi:hypothetical protein [Stenotrophomonas geniculata]|uniref:hypothetical protein n=1 Tax=Stenotrophomonas geniculata TaxID=86188 RepID=UPI002478AE20|nr:hypothetical protein [Stenotrophomonas geniculata]MDH7551894.1 hypothetical protein [Stenotrophomonas geniculata]
MDKSPRTISMLESAADAKLRHASALEADRSGSWKSQARRQRRAAALRASASGHQRAAHGLAGLDLPEDLPF